MWTFSDLPEFFLAFFLVFPLISLLHEAGHVFFAWLMGGKNIKITVGSGKPIFHKGILEIRKHYFWYGFCSFDNLRRKSRVSKILVFAGGSLFNVLGVILVVFLVENELLETGILTFQFTYFSMYYVFFALLPMSYPDGKYSDGKIILDLIRKKNYVIGERTYRVHWENKKQTWQVLGHRDKLIQEFTKEEEAMEKAREIALNHRPSRILSSKGGKEVEVQNYPTIPL